MPSNPGKGILILALGGLGIWILACAWYPLTDTDIWWHLASARRMLELKALLRSDPFCLASLGAPWIDLHWGFQLLVYALWKLGGAFALLAFKCAALFLAVAFCLKPHLDRRNAWLLLPAAAYGFYHIRFYLDMRPLVVTLLGLAAQYAVVDAYRSGRLRRPWLWLFPMQAAMANVQGLYPLGIFLVACFAAGEWWDGRQGSAEDGPERMRRAKALAATTVAMAGAGLLTPYGFAGFKLPLALLARITPAPDNVFSSGIAENQPWFSLARNDPQAALSFALLAAWALWTFDRARARRSAGHALLFAGFLALGFMAVRNLPLFYLAALMAGGRNLQVSPPGDAARDRYLRFGGMAVAAFTLIVHAPRIREAWEYELPRSLETPFRFPRGAVDFLAAHPLSGNLFNELRFGGYLEWRLPGHPVFLDGRMILRSAPFYREFLDVVDHPEKFPGYRGRYAFTHALIPIAEDKRYVPLAASLLRGGEWRLLYCDGAAALLALPGAGEAPALSVDSLPEDHPIRAALRARFGANPRLEAIATVNVAEFLQQAGCSRAVADLLRRNDAVQTGP